MEELLNKVEWLIEEEQGEIIGFASDYEALAIIAKEMSEAREEFAGLMGAYRDLKKLTFADDMNSDERKAMVARQMKMIALFGACELIQVSALCRKLEEIKDGEHV